MLDYNTKRSRAGSGGIRLGIFFFVSISKKSLHSGNRRQGVLTSPFIPVYPRLSPLIPGISPLISPLLKPGKPLYYLMKQTFYLKYPRYSRTYKRNIRNFQHVYFLPGIPGIPGISGISGIYFRWYAKPSSVSDEHPAQRQNRPRTGFMFRYGALSYIIKRATLPQYSAVRNVSYFHHVKIYHAPKAYIISRSDISLTRRRHFHVSVSYAR